MAGPEETREQIAQLYAGMSEEELKGLANEAWSLTDNGKDVLRAELIRRGLDFDLVMTPPEKAPSVNLVTLSRFRDMPEAVLAKSILDSAGVESALIDETTIRMDWLWSNALGGIKICVRQEDADAAARLLGREVPEKFNVEGVGEYEQPRCPQCQSLSISYRDLDKWLAYGGMFVALPIPLKDGRWKCDACGFEWQPTDESKQES